MDPKVRGRCTERHNKVFRHDIQSILKTHALPAKVVSNVCLILIILKERITNAFSHLGPFLLNDNDTDY